MKQTKRWRRWTWLVVRPVLVPLFLAVLLLEEWLWDPLERFAAGVGRLPVFRTIEAAILRLPPYGALGFFLIPSLVLFPFKLLALAAFAQGLFKTGLLIALGAKGVGTALVARIFTLTRPKLLSIGWFFDIYRRVQGWKQAVLGPLKAWFSRLKLREGRGMIKRLFRRVRTRLRARLSVASHEKKNGYQNGDSERFIQKNSPKRFLK
jgi:hypothetical protein